MLCFHNLYLYTQELCVGLILGWEQLSSDQQRLREVGGPFYQLTWERAGLDLSPASSFNT